MSAAAISAIALMPSASWASFLLSRISFISAAVFGSSSIRHLKFAGQNKWRGGSGSTDTMFQYAKVACLRALGPQNLKQLMSKPQPSARAGEQLHPRHP